MHGINVREFELVLAKWYDDELNVRQWVHKNAQLQPDNQSYKFDHLQLEQLMAGNDTVAEQVKWWKTEFDESWKFIYEESTVELGQDMILAAADIDKAASFDEDSSYTIAARWKNEDNIHQWFVTNVQNEIDDEKFHSVTVQQLEQLLAIYPDDQLKDAIDRYGEDKKFLYRCREKLL